MYCPRCGKADQKENTYCRQCGNFLPDFEKIKKREISPEDHIKANTVLTLLTGVVSLTLAIILYAMFLGKENTPVIIYVVAGFLTAMFAWQVQTFWRTLLLKKHLKKSKNFENNEDKNDSANPILESKPTNELLPEPSFEDVVPISVTENTTKYLKEKVKRLTKS
jgi:hypothetical protein